jgi:uroporphyrinogen-III decarboxylase
MAIKKEGTAEVMNIAQKRSGVVGEAIPCSMLTKPWQEIQEHVKVRLKAGRKRGFSCLLNGKCRWIHHPRKCVR